MKRRRFCRRAFSFSGCRESSLPARGGMAVRRSATFQIRNIRLSPKVIPAHFSRTVLRPGRFIRGRFARRRSAGPARGGRARVQQAHPTRGGPSRTVRRDRFGTANTGRRSRPRPPIRLCTTHRHDMALLWSAGCSNMSLSRKQAQTGAMLHRAAPSLGWRAWNAYATIHARSSMKTKRPIGATRN